jgi:hypothetical protein
MPITIDQARTAKDVAKTELAGVPGIMGIGLTKIGDDYALKINLRQALPANMRVPESIAGVPVKVEVVGTIRKRW